MSLPYTGKTGEKNFEDDVVELLIQNGWDKNVIEHKPISALIDNWQNIIFERNRDKLHDVPLSDSEMERLLDTVRIEANTPVKANIFIQGKTVIVKRDTDSADTIGAGNEIFLNIFNPTEIAGGTTKYQIARQVVFDETDDTSDRRGDITLLINGMPVIQIELKASGVPISDATNQIEKYIKERHFTGFMGLVQVFWAITPEDALYFSNPGEIGRNLNSAFFFRWADLSNKPITNWREIIAGQSRILSIPEAHSLVSYYTVADKAKDTLKVCRSYQIYAIKAIVSRIKNHRWGSVKDQRAGFVWCTTGGGKTMTSYKAGQLIIDRNYADKVVYLVDRVALDSQSSKQYNSFAPEGRKVVTTSKTSVLFSKLKSDKAGDEMIITSIQKMERITPENMTARIDELEKIKKKHIVFIVDEAHRSQFGIMHYNVKRTFPCALFVGFTGTPIFSNNMREGEQTTESVFGRHLSIYSLADGIRDGNVLGFYPQGESTFDERELRENVALKKANATSKDDAKKDPEQWKIYKHYMGTVKMTSEYDEYGKIKTASNGLKLEGIEDCLESGQYNKPEHREAVVKNIIDNFDTIVHGENGTLFHGILATSSIPEAFEYWKLFQKMKPELHITAIFDSNVDSNSGREFDVEKALIQIVDNYSQLFGLTLSWKTDKSLSVFKEDVMARLSHTEPYTRIGSDHSKCLDIVIVVNQLLTGFDSQYVNVLYLDKEMEYDNLIQAISRTNRVYDFVEKPMGFVKFYRKRYTMQKNLEDALALYCQGDKANVVIADIEDNIEILNNTFQEISDLFASHKIKNFSYLPKPNESRNKFRKEFNIMKRTMRIVMIQGLTFDNEEGKKLKFNSDTYRVLYQRYSDLPSSGSNGGKRKPNPGFNVSINQSTFDMDKIDADYLESRFKIITMEILAENEDRLFRLEQAIAEIRAEIPKLPQNMQKHAHQVLDDLKMGLLIPEKDKDFKEYIQEFAERGISEALKEIAEKYGIDFEFFFNLYMETTEGEINKAKLVELIKTSNKEKVLKHFGTTQTFKLYNELKDYIEHKKADEGDD